MGQRRNILVTWSFNLPSEVMWGEMLVLSNFILNSLADVGFQLGRGMLGKCGIFQLMEICLSLGYEISGRK